MLKRCFACQAARSAVVTLSREDITAYGAIMGFIEAKDRGTTEEDLCEFHREKFDMLRVVTAPGIHGKLPKPPAGTLGSA